MDVNYPQKANGMYCISRDNMDQLAYSILKEYAPLNLEIPTPLNTIKLLTEDLGLLVKSNYIGTFDSGILGLTVMVDDAEIPSVDLTYHPILLQESYGNVLISPALSGQRNNARRRYTEVHEASHWILHRPYYQHLAHQATGAAHKNYVACRKIERYQQKPASDLDWIEWQSDALAASLLMPRVPFFEFVRGQIRRAGAPCGYLRDNVSRDKSIYYDIIDQITDRLQVSRRAAQIRMINLGLIKSTN